MIQIKILGTGCAKCNRLFDATKQAADALGINYEIEKITDIMRFADFNVMLTPAMAIDGEAKVAGKVPSIEELKTILQSR